MKTLLLNFLFYFALTTVFGNFGNSGIYVGARVLLVEGTTTHKDDGNKSLIGK